MGPMKLPHSLFMIMRLTKWPMVMYLSKPNSEVYKGYPTMRDVKVTRCLSANKNKNKISTLRYHVFFTKSSFFTRLRQGHLKVKGPSIIIKALQIETWLKEDGAWVRANYISGYRVWPQESDWGETAVTSTQRLWSPGVRNGVQPFFIKVVKQKHTTSDVRQTNWS